MLNTSSYSHLAAEHMPCEEKERGGRALAVDLETYYSNQQFVPDSIKPKHRTWFLNVQKSRDFSLIFLLFVYHPLLAQNSTFQCTDPYQYYFFTWVKGRPEHKHTGLQQR